MSEVIREAPHAVPESTYWRRRIMVGVAAALAIGSAYKVIPEIADAVHPHQAPLPPACEITVGNGMTSWGIAEQIAQHDNRDPRTVLGEMVRTNPDKSDLGLVQPGATIELPKQDCAAIGQ